jgi:hypothetical protein
MTKEANRGNDRNVKKSSQKSKIVSDRITKDRSSRQIAEICIYLTPAAG